LNEIEGVLYRPKIRRQITTLTDEVVEQIIDTFQNHSILIEDPEELYELSQDNTDSKFTSLAIQTNSDHLVNRDNELLDLMDDPEFTSQFPDLKIMTPVRSLTIVRAE